MGITIISEYFELGCGRCPRFQSADCSTQLWREELAALRSIVKRSGLKEEVKWSHPCYTDNGKNVALIGAFRDCCVISFIKGALLSDPAGVLELPGENSQLGRVIRIRGLGQLDRLSDTILAYLEEAVTVERAGLEVEKIKIEDRPIPEELAAKFDEMPELREAFAALTPGRQRSYLHHFSQPKQSKTREARIDKCIDAIFAGIGFFDKA